jgi:hypothetical protein
VAAGVHNSMISLLEDEDYQAAANLLNVLATTNFVPSVEIYKKVLKYLRSENIQEQDRLALYCALTQLHTLHPYTSVHAVWRHDWNCIKDMLTQIQCPADNGMAEEKDLLAIAYLEQLFNKEASIGVPPPDRLFPKLLSASSDRAAKRVLLELLVGGVGKLLELYEKFNTTAGAMNYLGPWEACHALSVILCHLFDTDAPLALSDMRFDLWVAFKELPFSSKLGFLRIFQHNRHKMGMINFFLEKFDAAKVPKGYHSLQTKPLTYDKIIHFVYHLQPVSLRASAKRVVARGPKVTYEEQENTSELFVNMVYHLVKAWITENCSGFSMWQEFYAHTTEFGKRSLQICVQKNDDCSVVSSIIKQLVCIVQVNIK